jgi:hypothetical protein
MAAQRWGISQFFFVIKKNSNIFSMLKLAGRRSPGNISVSNVDTYLVGNGKYLAENSKTAQFESVLNNRYFTKSITYENRDILNR